MDTAARRRWLLTAILIGALYGVVGVGLGELSKLAPSSQVKAWRVAAWIISAVVFAMHIGYEHFRRNSLRMTTAVRASSGVALGAFLLAIAANVHGLWVGSSHQKALAISLLLWPALVALPAFLTALLASSLLTLTRHRINSSS